MAELSPQTREEHFLARIAGDTNAIVLKPVTRIEHFLQRIIDNGPSPGPGGEVTPASVVTATGQMTPQQAEATLGNIGGEPKALYVDIDDTTHAASETFATIFTAASAGVRVVFRVPLNLASAELYVVGKSASYIVAAATAYVNGPVALCYVLMADESATLYTLPLSEAPTVVTDLSSTSITLAPAANTVYNCGELASLTISNPPATGKYSIVFFSGATPTTLTIPQTLAMPDRFQVEANTRYEINVRDGYALCAGWAVNVS